MVDASFCVASRNFLLDIHVGASRVYVYPLLSSILTSACILVVLPQFPVMKIQSFRLSTSICDGTVKQYLYPSVVGTWVMGVLVHLLLLSEHNPTFVLLEK